MATVVPQVCFGSYQEPNSQSCSVTLSIRDIQRADRVRTVCPHEQVENVLMTVQRCDVERSVSLRGNREHHKVVQALWL